MTSAHLLDDNCVAEEETVLAELGVVRVLVGQVREAHGHVEHHALLHRSVVLRADDQRALAELDSRHEPDAEGKQMMSAAGPAQLKE